MINQAILTGKVLSIELKEYPKDKAVATVLLDVQRSFKNKNGDYDVDTIPLKLFNATARNTAKLITKGDVIGARCVLQTNDRDKSVLEVIANNITFLSMKKAY